MLPTTAGARCEWCELPFDDHVFMTPHGFEVCSVQCGAKIEAHREMTADERSQ